MKSNESICSSDYLNIMECILRDASMKCSVDVSDLRDWKTIQSRVKHQGMSFLTITLPQFCKDFERSLAEGAVSPSLFRSFRKRGAIPAFLQGMLGKLFNRETGRIIDAKNDPDSSGFSDIVDAIRQICLAFKKLEIPCTPKRESKALQAFIDTEHAFTDFQISAEDALDFIRVSSVLWSPLLRNIRMDECTPRHGPGQTSERIFGNAKFDWKYWHHRLEPFFPVVDTAYPLSITEGGPEQQWGLNGLTMMGMQDELPVRVCPVPKTLKGPRIIAIEPCCMQYAQQGIRDVLYDIIESSELTKGHINFRDQSVNQTLALSSSIDGRLATIDLKDASDRVPRFLALSMFRGNPDLRDAIDACRSRYAQMPDGTKVGPLRKFASMGSALCFPVEAMYFYTICVIALLKKHDLPVNRRTIFSVSRDVYVYGDDIIVPTAHTDVVLDHLLKYNCRVNTDKSFSTGKFRESCGVDAYDGAIVTPRYINKPIPENKQQADRLVSYVASGNLFYKKGYFKTASLLFKFVERVIGKLPYVSETSPGLGHNLLGFGSPSRKRVSIQYQRLEERLWCPTPIYRTDELEGYGALMKSLSKLKGLYDLSAIRDPLHLERTAVYGGLALQLRWVPSL